MKVKELKEFLSLYKDEQEVKMYGQSGLPWEIDEKLFAYQKLIDTKRKVCKLVIK